MKSLVNRVGKEPIERLKEAASGEGLDAPESLLDAARTIFGLNETSTEGADTDCHVDASGASDDMAPDCQPVELEQRSFEPVETKR